MSILSLVGGSAAFSSASGGKVYAFNVSDTLEAVAPPNPGRRKIMFHNPGTVDLFVGPGLVQTTGVNTVATPSPSFPAGTFLLFANGGTLTIEGECQGYWIAFSRTAGDNPITVMDSNV